MGAVTLRNIFQPLSNLVTFELKIITGVVDPNLVVFLGNSSYPGKHNKKYLVHPQTISKWIIKNDFI